MSTLVVKFSEHLHALLKQRAAQNRRSMTREVVHLVESGLGCASPGPLRPPVKLRSGRMLTVAEIEAAIAHGQK